MYNGLQKFNLKNWEMLKTKISKIKPNIRNILVTSMSLYRNMITKIPEKHFLINCTVVDILSTTTILGWKFVLTAYFACLYHYHTTQATAFCTHTHTHIIINFFFQCQSRLGESYFLR